MWTLPSAPANEIDRLRVLEACGVMYEAPDPRFERLTRLATRVYGADVAFIGLVDDQCQWLISVSSDALSRRVSRQESVCNLIVESGRPMVVGNLKTDPRLAGHPLVPHLALSFYAGAPILMDGTLVAGTLCVMRRDPAPEERFELWPLTDLAAVAASELQHMKLNRELRQRSETDALTGLPNRRAYDDALARALNRAQHTGAPVSLLLVDLDRFKQINDIDGHLRGDEVLKQIAGLLPTVLRRPRDSVARIGGEEFAIVLPDTDAPGATAVAEQVLTAIRTMMISHPAGGNVTASIGGATTRGGACNAMSLFDEADAALYAAKRDGRNTYRSAAA